MLTKRIIPCLDIKDGRVVKGINFKNFLDIGDPVELAKEYYKEGADEISLLDITASYEKRDSIFEIIKSVANEVYIPLSVGGGIKSVSEIQKIMSFGAEKVSIGSSSITNPNLIEDAANRFGSQAIVLSLDVKRNFYMKSGWEIYILGGKLSTGIDALTFACKMEKKGAGEILLNSIDQDGMQTGYDLELIKLFSEALNIPIIASGGAGSLSDIKDVFSFGKVDAALVASLLHLGKYRISQIKTFLFDNNLEVRI